MQRDPAARQDDAAGREGPTREGEAVGREARPRQAQTPRREAQAPPRQAQAMRRHALWIARAMARTDLTPLQPADVAALEQICRVRAVTAGTVLATAGSPVGTIYVVQEGEVHLATRRTVGGRHLVGIMRAGNVVGDIPMFCEQPMPFDALAGTDCTVIELDRDQLVPLLQRSPTLSLRWTTSVAKRLEQTQRRMVSLLTGDLEAQIATLLLDEREAATADDTDAQGREVARLSHATIAQLLGVRRQSVSRAMGRMRKRGLVEGGYREIILADVEGLHALAGAPVDEPDAGEQG